MDISDEAISLAAASEAEEGEWFGVGEFEGGWGGRGDRRWVEVEEAALWAEGAAATCGAPRGYRSPRRRRPWTAWWRATRCWGGGAAATPRGRTER